MTDLMINPPKPGDESFPKFDKVALICYPLLEAYKNIIMTCHILQERSDILTSLKKRAETISARLNKIEGIECNTIQGAMYAFPKIHLPSGAIAKAKVEPVLTQ